MICGQQHRTRQRAATHRATTMFEQVQGSVQRKTLTEVLTQHNVTIIEVIKPQKFTIIEVLKLDNFTIIEVLKSHNVTVIEVLKPNKN